MTGDVAQMLAEVAAVVEADENSQRATYRYRPSTGPAAIAERLARLGRYEQVGLDR